METLLHTKQLTKTYLSEGTPVTALQALDIEIYKGEFTIIMGSSGSGKSTLLYVLSGLDKASSGEVYYRNQPLHTQSETALAVLRRKGFGFVFQNINLIPNLTIIENVTVPGYLTEKDRNKVLARARELLRVLAIEPLADRLPAQVSGGEQQRAAIARALINAPDLLLADEPTGALNFATGQTILNYLNQINTTGQTIVMVTHDLKAACRGQRVLFFRDGGIQGEFRFPAHLQDVAAQLEAREKALFEWLTPRGW